MYWSIKNKLKTTKETNEYLYYMVMVCALPWVNMSWWSAAMQSPWVTNYIVHMYCACIRCIKKEKEEKKKKNMYTPCVHETDHNTIPFVGLKPLQSEITFVIESIIIDRWWFVRTIGRIMARLWNFTFKADKLRAIGSVMYVWTTDGTENETTKRWNGWCNNVGNGDEVLNSTVTSLAHWSRV